MAKIKCVLSYDGTNFSGFQIQPRKRTIHGEIEKALQKIHKGLQVKIQASGRTDAGVHAKGQTFQFETPYNLPLYNWQKALNTLLPDDLYIHLVEKVPSTFHARYDAVEKEYRYYIWNEKEIDVFKRNYAYQFPHPLDIEAMQEACRYLQGEHDFTTFSSAKATVKGSRIRTLSQATCEKVGNEIEFIFRSNGFLYHMVRIIVGCLIDIGQGRRLPTDIPKLLEKKDRQLLGETVPPQGLYLWEVKYE
jgi:tRNA pseudouridine38-40 synthase